MVERLSATLINFIGDISIYSVVPEGCEVPSSPDNKVKSVFYCRDSNLSLNYSCLACWQYLVCGTKTKRKSGRSFYLGKPEIKT